MMAENTAGIIKEICEAMAGDECSQWQVGVTADPEQLLKILRIPTDPECFVCFRATNPSEARAIAEAFWNIQSGKSPQSAQGFSIPSRELHFRLANAPALERRELAQTDFFAARP